MIGEHCIRCQTATQSALALSSGEAEFLGNVKGASIGIGMQLTARDFGDETSCVRIATDISASEREFRQDAASVISKHFVRPLERVALAWQKNKKTKKA